MWKAADCPQLEQSVPTVQGSVVFQNIGCETHLSCSQHFWPCATATQLPKPQGHRLYPVVLPITQALTFPKHFCFNTCESSTPPQTSGMHFCLLSSGTEAAICLTLASPPIRPAAWKEGLCIGLGEHVSGPGEQVLAPWRVSRRTSARRGIYKGRSHHRSPAL